MTRAQQHGSGRAGAAKVFCLRKQIEGLTNVVAHMQLALSEARRETPDLAKEGPSVKFDVDPVPACRSFDAPKAAYLGRRHGTSLYCRGSLGGRPTDDFNAV